MKEDEGGRNGSTNRMRMGKIKKRFILAMRDKADGRKRRKTGKEESIDSSKEERRKRRKEQKSQIPPFSLWAHWDLYFRSVPLGCLVGHLRFIDVLPHSPRLLLLTFKSAPPHQIGIE